MKVFDLYETDESAEQEGVWVDIGGGAKLKIARYGNPKHLDSLKRLRKPYEAEIRSGIELEKHIRDKLTIEAMVDAILLDWQGIQENDGTELPYSKDNARRVLALTDFRDKVSFLCTQMETFRKSALEAAAKN